LFQVETHVFNTAVFLPKSNNYNHWLRLRRYISALKAVFRDLKRKVVFIRETESEQRKKINNQGTANRTDGPCGQKKDAGGLTAERRFIHPYPSARIISSSSAQ